MSDEIAHLRPDEGLGALSGMPSHHSLPVFQHGSLNIRLYAPRGQDLQTPHSRYIVKGSGLFFNGTDRKTFRPGDSLFVSAGIVDCFEGFSDELLLGWSSMGRREENSQRHPARANLHSLRRPFRR